MPVPAEIAGIQGSAELHDWFGYWPNFHDAEIISLHLNRSGHSSMRAHTWEMTKEIDQNGYYVLTKHLVVEFVFENRIRIRCFDCMINSRYFSRP